MKIPWSENRCILCLKQCELTEEHIIPRTLGGKLWVKFLCKCCNDNLGSKVESEVKRDPSISFAIENLSQEIPELAKVLMEDREYIGISKFRNVRGKIKRGEFRIKSYKEKDGSLIQPTDLARKNLRRILRKGGTGEEEIQSLLRGFDEMPSNTRIEVKEGLDLIKWDIESVQSALSGNLIGDLLPLKMSFEFFACCLGSSIYDERLNNIRNSILLNTVSTDTYKVEYLRGAEYRPSHIIVIEKSVPYVVIQIRLFGWLVYRVHFLRLALDGSRFGYVLNLKEIIEDVIEIG